jgi:hypothetical protein
MRPTSEKANVFDSGILLLSLIMAQLAFELGKTSSALHSPKASYWIGRCKLNATARPPQINATA